LGPNSICFSTSPGFPFSHVHPSLIPLALVCKRAPRSFSFLYFPSSGQSCFQFGFLGIPHHQEQPLWALNFPSDIWSTPSSCFHLFLAFFFLPRLKAYKDQPPCRILSPSPPTEGILLFRLNPVALPRSFDPKNSRPCPLPIVCQPFN